MTTSTAVQRLHSPWNFINFQFSIVCIIFPCSFVEEEKPCSLSQSATLTSVHNKMHHKWQFKLVVEEIGDQHTRNSHCNTDAHFLSHATCYPTSLLNNFSFLEDKCTQLWENCTKNIPILITCNTLHYTATSKTPCRHHHHFPELSASLKLPWKISWWHVLHESDDDEHNYSGWMIRKLEKYTMVQPQTSCKIAKCLRTNFDNFFTQVEFFRKSFKFHFKFEKCKRKV